LFVVWVDVKKNSSN